MKNLFIANGYSYAPDFFLSLSLSLFLPHRYTIPVRIAQLFEGTLNYSRRSWKAGLNFNQVEKMIKCDVLFLRFFSFEYWERGNTARMKIFDWNIPDYTFEYNYSFDLYKVKLFFNEVENHMEYASHEYKFIPLEGGKNWSINVRI